MIEVVILGAGNVAFHLFRAFSEAENTRVIQVYNHLEENLNYFKDYTNTTNRISDLKSADFYLLALKDDVIADVAHNLKDLPGIVLHTSGAVSLNALENLSNFGVFYPLQTFSKNKLVDFGEIPVCIEANSAENLEKIKKLALEITKDVREVNSEQRKALHLAAVFVNNFSNHLYTLGAEICEKNQVDFSILRPLIKETASKIESLAPKDAQTGPAIRNDQKTIEAHLRLLPKKNKDIYSILTQSIQDFHGKKL
ncbi:Rossmann-like and DUF2520 domain-containing protein [Salegentibacter sp. T436]|jgi:predicted short-subunit dehydrogenase-like oxidoreductase (DUF2520 family)|uniref:Rossmann-like and DUF2520 domain-containing protein n=1 Tax=Salegentibacter sp. T436 TaxID=1729720 RepID=UPI00094A19D6|nr:DUF2520 domain-containing protein [Salegentibacter sp. T436]APS39490.1 hypothetical protein AO058_11660 [Salegentibacter sp. T436]|tara:strand:- start:573 stop:1334 length:762 start_codon:yes stop_codon:yes gene_type:complete